jgi:hypothetical protein
LAARLVHAARAFIGSKEQRVSPDPSVRQPVAPKKVAKLNRMEK